MTRALEATPPAKLYIGCGLHPVEGWINIDKSLGPFFARHPFLKRAAYFARLLSRQQYDLQWSTQIWRHDVRKGLPFDDESVDAIACDAVIAYMSASEAHAFLGQCHRILRPRGHIRIRVWDLEQRVHAYLADKEEGRVDAADRLATNLKLGRDARGPFPYGLIYRTISYFDHAPNRWAYDFDSLASRLSAIGFEEIQRVGNDSGKLRGVMAIRPNSPWPLIIEAVRSQLR
jgi:predicted SAM-dependent methyltransferase